MKILIFNWRDMKHPQAGGAELYLYEQARIWITQGHQVLWICSRSYGQANKDVQEGIEVFRKGGRYSLYLCAWWQYFQLKEKPDVIIDAENGIPFFTPLFTHIPVVLLIYHIHRNVWLRETSRFIATAGRFLEEKIMPLVYRHAPIVTISQSSSDMISNVFTARSDRPKIIYCGFSEALTPGTKSTLPELIFVGRLRRYKCIDSLLRALAALKNDSVLLHIVGQGDDEQRLKDLANTLKLGERVTFHGHISNHEKLQLLQRSWIAVNPSSMEGWGITNIEANACGTPVLGADVPGIRDSISPGNSGWLFKCEDDQALTDKLESLLNTPETIHSLDTSCRLWAEQFSWTKSANTFLDILKKEAGAE